MSTLTVPKQRRETWTDQWGHSHAITNGYPTPEGYKPRMTGVLQAVIAKPNLIGWSARIEREEILDAVSGGDATTAAILATLATRNGVYKSGQNVGKPKLTHEVKRDAAGDMGTQVHDWALDWWMKGRIGQVVGPEPQMTTEGARIAQGAMRPWLETVPFTPQYIEHMTYLLNAELPPCGVGGRLDFAGLFTDYEVVDHRGSQGRVSGFCLNDLKTGSGVYMDHLLQIAGYGYALHQREGTPWPCPGLIVHPPKSPVDAAKWGGRPELYLVPPERMARLWVGVRAVMNLYEVLQEGV